MVATLPPAIALPWSALLDGSAGRADAGPVTVTGWPVTAMEAAEARYCLLVPEPACCGGCLPGNPAACIEIVADAPVPLDGRAVTLRGEVFNVTNHANVVGYNGVYGNNTNGQPLATFGQPLGGIANVEPGRQYQLELCLRF